MTGRKVINKNNVGFFTKIKAYLVGFCYDFVNFLLRLFSSILWPSRLKKTPKKICIYRIGNIGDTICTVPAIIAIRKAYPDAHITLLTSPGKRRWPSAEQLLKGAWFIDELKIYYSDDIKGLRSVFNFIKRLRTESFDLLIYLPQELIKLRILLRNLIFIKFCKVKKAIGFELSTIKFWTKAQSAIYQFDDEVDRLMNLIKRLGISIDGSVDYELPVSESVKKSALKIANQYQINLNSGFIFGFMPGASHYENQWSLDNFVKVGKFILKNYPNSKIIIFGGPDDHDKGKYIKDEIGNNSIIDLSGKISLLETAFFINNLTLLVSNNTGLMHMAALAGKKVIAIFSAEELNGKWFPYGKNSKIFMKRKTWGCDGFYYKKIPGSNKCINMIAPKEIEEEIGELLNKNGLT